MLVGIKKRIIKNGNVLDLELINPQNERAVDHSVQVVWIDAVPDPNPFIEDGISDNDIIVLFISGDHEKPEELGAEVRFTLNNRTHSVNTATAVFIPRGVSFGEVTWKRVSKPHVFLTLALGSSYSDSVDHDRLVVTRPVYEIWPENPAEGRMESSMTFLNSQLVPGCEVYLEYSWIYNMPDPNPHIMAHAHPEHDEIVMHIGCDSENPADLGAEIEIGYMDETLLLNSTCALFVPSGVNHGPLVWKQVSRPHIEMGVVLGAGSLAASDPGGHLARNGSERG